MAEPLVFTGLRNQGNPLSLSPGCLQQADDVIVTQYGMIESRWGYGAGRGFDGCTDLWSPEHQRYGFLVADGTLYQGSEGLTSLTTTVVTTGLVDETYHWAATPTGDNAFFAGATEAGRITKGVLYPLRVPMPSAPIVEILTGNLLAGAYQVTQIYRHVSTGLYSPAASSTKHTIPIGKALSLTSYPPAGYAADIYVTAADSTVERYLATVTVAGTAILYDQDPDTLDWPTPFSNVNAWPFPDGPVDGLAWRDGFLFVGVYSSLSSTTRIYRSREWQYHLWERDAWEEDQAGARVTGRCRQIMGLDEGLLVMTDKMVGLISPDMKTMTRLANYGTPPGRPAAKDQYGVVVHTNRGLRTFPPWDDSGRLKHVQNPGAFAYAFVGEMRGIRYAQVQTEVGGVPYNRY